MDDFLASATVDDGRSIHIAPLSRQTIIDSGAEHLGFGGYFVFETCEEPGNPGICVLGKAASFEGAVRLVDLWMARPAA
jgi:hypothetical protein